MRPPAGESRTPPSSTQEPTRAEGTGAKLRPPTYVAPCAGTIPDDLKVIDHWVAWRYEPRRGTNGETTVTKVPIDALTGGYAKANTRATWSSFAQAWERYERDGLDGVGFVLVEDGELVGFDVDKCVEPETGAIGDEVNEILQELDSYAELSPSGRGIRAFARGQLPEGWRKRGHFEFYDNGRFLTVTGARLNERAIEERVEQIARVHARIAAKSKAPRRSGKEIRKKDERKAGPRPAKRSINSPDSELLARLRGSSSGPKFSGLYAAGDWQGLGYGSQSEADLALCAMIAARCGGDPARVDAIFRASALMRAKWDEKHFADGRTYGEETIAKAVSSSRGAGVVVGVDEAQRVRLPDTSSLMTLTHASERLLERHPGNLLWSHVGVRYVWVGSHWREDRRAAAEQWADDVAQSYKMEADQLQAIAEELDKPGARIEDELRAAIEKQFPPLEKNNGRDSWEAQTAKKLRERAKDRLKLFARLERPAGFAELLGRIAAYHTCAVEELDAKPLLIACPNGTLDLETGGLRPAAREDLLTRVTGVDYIQAAKSAAWERALGDWTDGDESIARYLRAAYGYSLLGNPVLGRYCFVLHGPGQSGRSALLETLAAAVGDYGSSFSWRAFERRHGASHDEDLAALRGLRFVFSNEAGDLCLDTEKLKAVTSGEEQHVSRKNERSFRMRPSFVVWAATNRLPELPSDDTALWTRLRVVPFRRVFEVSDFRSKLAHDQGVLLAVLAWGAAGARDYLDHGLPLCAAVDRATREAQKELDPIAAWREECTEGADAAWTPVGALFADYGRWCERNGVSPRRRVGDRRFGELMKATGLEAVRRNGVRGYRGIKLAGRAASAVAVP